MRGLSRFFRRGTPDGPDPAPDPPPAPERLTYAVGDIHGCLDPLDRLLAAISADADGRPHDIVFLGDYVDRGPQSAGVLHRLCELDTGRAAAHGGAAEPPAGARIVCLVGNHDYMMLHFIADPEDGVNWLLAGGMETMTSFGVPLVPLTGGGGGTVAERVAAQAGALADALGDELTGWLADRPLWWRSGDLVAVHALTDPARPMEEQEEHTLLWARPGADNAPRADGTWVVHGHTIVAEPRIRARHVNVDTGAFNGGPLSAAVFAPGADIRFLSVESGGADPERMA